MRGGDNEALRPWIPGTEGLRQEAAYFFLPWVLPGILGSWDFAGRSGLRLPSGDQRWSLLAAVERPRTAQGRGQGIAACGLPSADGGPLDVTRLNLSRRQSATKMGSPADQARVRLTVPPTGISHAAGTVNQSTPRRPTRGPGAGVLSLGSFAHLGSISSFTCSKALYLPWRIRGPSPLAPQDLARAWHDTFIPQHRATGPCRRA